MQVRRPTLDEGPGSNFLVGTNYDWFEANWIFELDSTLVPSLILGSPNQELSFQHYFLVPTNWFSPPKQVPCKFSLNLPLFGLGPSSKGLGTNLKLLTNKIAWINWSLDLGPSSKVALKSSQKSIFLAPPGTALLYNNIPMDQKYTPTTLWHPSSVYHISCTQSLILNTCWKFKHGCMSSYNNACYNPN